MPDSTALVKLEDNPIRWGLLMRQMVVMVVGSPDGRTPSGFLDLDDVTLPEDDEPRSDWRYREDCE